MVVIYKITQIFIYYIFLKIHMKIFICCSQHNYHKVQPIKEELEKQGHIITVPNSFDEPFKEEDMKKLGKNEHIEWKQKMMRLQEPKVRENDAVFSETVTRCVESTVLTESSFGHRFNHYIDIVRVIQMFMGKNNCIKR